jgi:DDE superfamily endonuclease
MEKILGSSSGRLIFLLSKGEIRLHSSQVLLFIRKTNNRLWDLNISAAHAAILISNISNSSLRHFALFIKESRMIFKIPRLKILKRGTRPSFFHRYTKGERVRHRLLIINGYSSHINMSFISLADSLRIILQVLPPHTTYRLQPLDVGLFQP